MRKHALPLDATRTAAAARPLAIALVTEDDALRETCVRALGNGDYVVHPARHSGHVLLACLAGEPIDLLIAEMTMADGSGPALMRRLRQHIPDLRAIYIARAGTTLDCDNVIVRPFTRDDLLKRIEAARSRPR